MDPKLERRLRKLLALAERGIGGEQANAQRMLDNLLKKHGITLEDIAGESVEMRWFKHKGAFNKRLLGQVIGMVCGRDRDWYKSPGYRSCIGVRVTAAEHAEILIHFEAYSKSLEDQLETAFIAFLHRHRIFPPPMDGDKKELTDPGEAERVWAMMVAMPEVSVRRQINDRS